MSRSTISTFELFALIPDQESARAYLEARLWPHGAMCPVCGLGERIGPRRAGLYRCYACREDFSVRTGTIMERSHLGLREWLAAMLMVAQNPEISTETMAKELGVTQKTAHSARARLHKAARDMMEAYLAADGDDYRIVQAHPGYRVGADGSVWSRHRAGPGGRMGYAWHQLATPPDRDGYRTVCVSTPSETGQTNRKVSVLVCEAFHGPAPTGQECRHLDGSRDNDRADNLAWGTPKQNQEDRRIHGRAPAGAQNGNAHLSDGDVNEIVALRGRMLQREIADRFGTSQSHVSRIHRGAQRAKLIA